MTTRLPRVVIEDVGPALDGGRHPVKRSLGERLRVAAAVYKDGHELVCARVRYRRPGERRWQHAPMRYAYEPDRWFGEIGLDALGRWAFAVEGWPDPIATWRSDLRKRVDAGHDVATDLVEGAAMLEQASGSGGRGRLRAVARRIADPEVALEERLAEAFDPRLGELAAGPLEPSRITRSALLEVVVDRERARFGAWYEMFPRSQSDEPGRHGTFRDAERRLPAIAQLGFDVVYLPPIHPIGRTHRKGPDNTPGADPRRHPGSPWAIGGPEGGHTAIHPALGDFEDFERFVHAAKRCDLEIALDYALQCSPDHPWVKEHPDWFHQRPDGRIHYAENPPKKYEDIYPLDFWCDDREGLWSACRDVLLFWIERGVRIFRVDNPHTKPFAFWEWCLRDVQQRHPDVVFLAEAFTRPQRMYGLAKIGFSQSYTYFTWKNHWWELHEFLRELTRREIADFFRPNFFANTPDILHEYLQRGGRPAFRVRLLLAATLSPSYGIYSGFELFENQAVRPGSEEYAGSEKYQIRQRDWDTPENLHDEIETLNRIRRENRALQWLDNLHILGTSNPEVLWFRKHVSGNQLLVAVNLDPEKTQEALVEVPLSALGLHDGSRFTVHDLLTGEHWDWSGSPGYVRLDPQQRVGHVFRVEGGDVGSRR